MTSPQETQHQGCADFFSELPPELRMEILNQTPIQDIRLLISASPALLRIFQRHRASLLRHHLQYLLRFYGDKSILPFVVFTMDLRALRAQSQHLTASELEEKLKPALNSIQSRKCTRQPSAGYLDFQILEKAQNLVPELCRAFDTHQEGPYNSTPRPSSHFLLEEASWQVKFTFIEKFLRFDCYCNMFYYRTQSLFSISNRVETKLESPLLHHATNSVERFPRTIISTLFKGYQDLISRLDYSLRSRQPNPGDTPESPNQNISTLQRNEFLDRDMPQEQSYLSHLIMGGYPLFEKLQSLTAEEFEHYTLKEFYQVVTVKLTPVAFYALLTFTHMPLL
ncbi:uncharacterized protein FSUBG_9455 [Fusarium subglutinans]|uniref:F-box domain-containing protein n=1 Tax=Gibberella subglutinans TaxID=42677 RepID=A0A8H5PDC6_GIBSU|nr:uncharacterized protein FSUBG_9455 [Fusarium subglutinans]KAF5594353.1 hypothetical protein FSUBG_9455 [Fusarium subglutinans]